MTDYVVGFLIDNANRVALIQKNRPEWQAGLLNGVGGHVERHEAPAEAMRREFFEEAGLDIDTWKHFLTLHSGEHRIYFYREFVSYGVLNQCKAKTDEPIVNLTFLVAIGFGAVLNLSWILPLAFYRHDYYQPIEVTEI